MARHLYDVTLSVTISVEIPEGIDPESDEARDLAAAAADAADLPGELYGGPDYLEPDDDD